MAAKLSQEDLRRLMRETKAKKVARIESPLARYDGKGKLSCVICNVSIESEASWSDHLVDGNHKKKIEELKQKQKKPAAPAELPTKAAQKRPNTTFKVPVAKKISKFENVSEFSKKEMSIKQAATNNLPLVDAGPENDADDEPQAESIEPEAGVPTDFFDDPSQAMEVASSTEKTDSSLPKGFFDDPMQDARARHTKKTVLDEEMDIFFKEIAQETIVSEEAIEQDIEKSEKEKLIDEIDEQINNWAKVDLFQKKIEEIHRKKQEHKPNTDDTKMEDGGGDDNDTDSDSDDDLDDDDFWRTKSLA